MKADFEWLKIKKKWKKLNPPNHEGYYTCGICKRAVHYTEVEIDHILPRSARPDLRFTMSNLQPAHHLCNFKKGSKHGERIFNSDW